jgi:hypothetical protein
MGLVISFIDSKRLLVSFIRATSLRGDIKDFLKITERSTCFVFIVESKVGVNRTTVDG